MELEKDLAPKAPARIKPAGAKTTAAKAEPTPASAPAPAAATTPAPTTVTVEATIPTPSQRLAEIHAATSKKPMNRPEEAHVGAISRHDPDAIRKAFETGDYPYSTKVTEK